MEDEQTLRELSDAIAAAIARRDVDMLASVLAPGFVHRGEGGAVSESAAFLDAIRGIPGQIEFVRVHDVAVDLAGDAAMVTGRQHARVTADGQAMDDRRTFADFFVRIDGRWKLRAAMDMATAP